MMKKILDMLKIKYTISTLVRRAGQSIDSTTITVPRIAATFPTITVGLFHRELGRMLVDPTLMFGEDHEMPRAFFSLMVSSVIPQGGGFWSSSSPDVTHVSSHR